LYVLVVMEIGSRRFGAREKVPTFRSSKVTHQGVP
jgi:hypothetical protein